MSGNGDDEHIGGSIRLLEKEAAKMAARRKQEWKDDRLDAYVIPIEYER